MGPCDESRFPRSRAVTGSARRGRRAADGAASRPGTYTRKERGTRPSNARSSHGTWRKTLREDPAPEEGAELPFDEVGQPHRVTERFRVSREVKRFHFRPGFRGLFRVLSG